MELAEQTNTARPVRVQIGAWMTAGWDWFVQDFWTNLLVGLLASLLIGALALLTGPTFAGLASCGLQKNKTGRVVVRDFFDGFANFIPALVASLLIFVFVMAGLILLVIPGLVIMAMYMFTFHFMIDRGMDFWDAMEASRKLVSGDYLGFVLFTLFLGVINLLGLMLLGVGVLFTIPITGFAVTAAYLDSAGTRSLPTAPPVRID